MRVQCCVPPTLYDFDARAAARIIRCARPPKVGDAKLQGWQSVRPLLVSNLNSGYMAQGLMLGARGRSGKRQASRDLVQLGKGQPKRKRPTELAAWRRTDSLEWGEGRVWGDTWIWGLRGTLDEAKRGMTRRKGDDLIHFCGVGCTHPAHIKRLQVGKGSAAVPLSDSHPKPDEL